MSECAQGIIDAADGRPVTRVEHTSHYLLIDAEQASECQAGKAAVPKREGKSGLRSRFGWDSDVVLPGTSGARQRYGFVVVKAPGDRFVQRVGRLGECVRFVDATSQTLRQIPERNDNLVSTCATQLGRINETHQFSLIVLFLPHLPGLNEVTPIEAQLANHGGKEPGRNLLPTIFDRSLARPVVQSDMTALATLGVDTNRDPADPRNLRDSFDELPPGHGPIVGR